jgi:hypothetical protein
MRSHSPRGLSNHSTSPRLCVPMLVVLATAMPICGGAYAEDRTASLALASDQPGDAALLKKLDEMERRIRFLEGRLRQKDAETGGNAVAQAKDATKNAETAGTSPGSTKPATETQAKENPGNDRGRSNPAGAAKTPKTANRKAKDSLAADASLAATQRDITGREGPVNPPSSILGMTSPVSGLSIGAYGEMLFGAMQNPAAGGQWQNGADVRRMVLLPTYAITDNIIFNAEIEWEHGGNSFGADDKLAGEIDIEQLWIDFKIVDEFNWRAPGIDLIPIGYINQHHEPTAFYSVLRPELYNGLIPSTWMAPATSIYGRLTDGLYYTVMASTSMEDFGGSFSTRTDANTVPPFPTGYPPGIDGKNALGFARPAIGDFRQLNNDVAIGGQLSYSPPALPGFSGSVSTYYTPNVTPRGAYADNGMPLGRSSLGMFDAEFRYRIPDTGFEVRADSVFVSFGDPASLRANNDSDPTDNVGKSMYGYSGELAYHLPLGTILTSEWEAVPFYRYTFQNTQTGGFAGIDANTPTGAGQTQFHNLGIAVFPSPELVLKATWQKVINRDPAGAQSDSFLGGVGFFF